MSCSQDRSLCLWNPQRDDMKDGFLIKRYKGPHSNAVNDVSMYVYFFRTKHRSPDNQGFVSCGDERDIFFWDVTNARVIRRYFGHSQVLNRYFDHLEGQFGMLQQGRNSVCFRKL